MTNITGIIPARFASTRFPGKPLIEIGGKSMIQRVYEQCKSSTYLTDVIVATDDERIEQHVLSFGGKVMITSSDHQSGTDRCAEVVSKMEKMPDVVINIQGDEPFIKPEQIDTLAKCFEDKKVEIASLYKKIDKELEVQNPNTVKVVLNENKQALLFSRSAIPYRRNQGAEITFYKHIGIYGYRAQTLLAITQLKPSMLELAESLEQLRWIENGYKIRMQPTEWETISIDTPDDLKLVENYLKN